MDNSRFEKMYFGTRERIRSEQKKLESASESYSPKYFLSKSMGDCGLGLFRKKVNKISVRGFFAEQCFLYLEEIINKNGKHIRDRTIFTQKIPLLIDGLMTIMYHDNHFFDQKSSAKGHIECVESSIAGKLLRAKLQKYIIDNFEKNYKCSTLFNYMEKALQLVDKGQYIDKFHGNYSNFISSNPNHYFEEDKIFINDEIDAFSAMTQYRHIIEQVKIELSEKSSFVELYFRRLYLTNIALFRLTVELIIDMIGHEITPKERENIINFAEGYGLLLQIINDIADFVLDSPPIEKSEIDIQSDIRNKTITLPLIYHLCKNKNKGKIENYMVSGNDLYLNGHHNEILKEIISSGAIDYNMKLVKQVAKHTSSFLDKKNSNSKFLKSMLDISYINRFYWHIREAKRTYKRGELYKCEKNISSNLEMTNSRQKRRGVNSISIKNKIKNI